MELDKNKFWITINDLQEDLVTTYDINNFAHKQIERLAKERSKFIDEQLLKFGINLDNIKEYHIDVKLHNDWTETFNIYKKEYKWWFMLDLRVN